MFRISIIFILFGSIQACSQLKTENGVVCVCNSTYCDVVPDLELPTNSDIEIFYTSATQPGFNLVRATFLQTTPQNPIISIGGTVPDLRPIIGFGGAFTDATGQNIRRLPEDAQQKLLESYFGPEGIGYSVCRVPIGGTDFSPRPYSYDDHDDDTELKYFALQEEDLNFKVSLMLRF